MCGQKCMCDWTARLNMQPDMNMCVSFISGVFTFLLFFNAEDTQYDGFLVRIPLPKISSHLYIFVYNKNTVRFLESKLFKYYLESLYFYWSTLCNTILWGNVWCIRLRKFFSSSLLVLLTIQCNHINIVHNKYLLYNFTENSALTPHWNKIQITMAWQNSGER